MLQYPVSGSGVAVSMAGHVRNWNPNAECGRIGTGSHEEVASVSDRDNQEGECSIWRRKGHLEDGAGVQ